MNSQCTLLAILLVPLTVFGMRNADIAHAPEGMSALNAFAALYQVARTKAVAAHSSLESGRPLQSRDEAIHVFTTYSHQLHVLMVRAKYIDVAFYSYPTLDVKNFNAYNGPNAAQQALENYSKRLAWQKVDPDDSFVIPKKNMYQCFEGQNEESVSKNGQDVLADFQKWQKIVNNSRHLESLPAPRKPLHNCSVDFGEIDVVTIIRQKAPALEALEDLESELQWSDGKECMRLHIYHKDDNKQEITYARSHDGVTLRTAINTLRKALHKDVALRSGVESKNDS